MINDLVFNVCMALVVAIFGIIARELIPFLKEKYSETLKRIEATKWAWAVDIIDSVVRAVEQTVIEEHGEEKKTIARQMIHRAMKEANIYLSDTQIDMLIEAAVNAMNGEKVATE
jgi:LL-H family phage holin